MRLTTCYVFLVLGVALTVAGPAPKIIEKKSLAEDGKLDGKKDLAIDEAGGEKDRTKKSATTVCVHIKPGAQPTQTSCNNREQTIQQNPRPQQLQLVNVAPVQPAQPVHMVHIVQPPQPCAQPSVNIIQPAPQPAPQTVQPVPQVVQPVPQTVQPEEPKPQVPEPTPSVEIVKPVQEEPRPAQIVQPAPLPEPQETLNVLPVAPACNEQLYTIPSSVLYYPTEQQQLATVVQVPTQCNNPPQHGFQCTCRQRNMVMGSGSSMEPMRAMLMDRSTGTLYRANNFGVPEETLPMMYSGYNSNIMSPIVSSNADSSLRTGPQPRTTIIKVRPPSHHHIYHKTYIHGLEPEYNPYPIGSYVNGAQGSGITINAYPHLNAGPFYRSATSESQPSYKWAEGSLANPEGNIAAESSDLMEAGKKVPREIDLNQLAPETNEYEIERSARSSKDEKITEQSE